MSNRRPTLALIDGHALAFRAFHALSKAGLRSSSGEPTYAIFGFMSILLNMIHEHHPKYVAVAFDVGRTFRDDMYAEYKAGRGEIPSEFHPQLDRIKQLVTALNIPIYTAEGFEADDVIGTLARQATSHDTNTMILTGDTDTLQLVDDHVRVLLANPYGQKTTTLLYDEDQVRERYKGLAPSQLADLRGLKGDTSDNIPGVKGIAEAGAITLLMQFGTVANLYEHLDEAPNRYKKLLDGKSEQALFSTKIATIVCDAPVTLDLRACELHDYDRNAVIAMFHELEFGATMVKRLPATGSAMEMADLPSMEAGSASLETSDSEQATLSRAPSSASSSDDPQQLAMFDLPATPAARPAALVSLPAGELRPALGAYQAVRTEDELRQVVAALAGAPAFAFDTETLGTRAVLDDIVGLSVSIQPGQAWYVPFGHRNEEQQLPRETVLAALRPFFADPKQPKYGHNAKFDIEVLEHAGVPVVGVTFDTMLAAALLDKKKGLKDLAFYELRLPEPMTDIEELIGKRGKNQLVFADVPIERATAYAAADADMTMRLVEALAPQLAEQDKVNEIFKKLEMPLVPVLVRMEQAGIGLNVPFMRELGTRMGDQLVKLEDEIYAIAGGKFNINSGDQLSDTLFNKLGLPTAGLERTKTGRYSLTAGVLEKLQTQTPHPIIDLILRYRQLTKLKSTYVDSLPDIVNPETGRVHTTYSQLGAATGRLSSNDPNLQNIPTRTDDGREIRRGFVATPGHVFVAADYSQIELRVLAHITQDKNLVQAFTEGEDIHAATASQLFGVPMKEISKNQRRVAKTVIFGVIYGISSFGLAPRIDASRSEAQRLIDELFARFPGLRDYMTHTLENGRRDGFVQSLFGRRRYMPELRTGGPRKQAAEREAINAPIQATAADIMKIAMIRVDEELRRNGLKTRMLLQVHDELIFEAPQDEVQQVIGLVRECMECAYTLNVPLRVEVETGTNWEEMVDAAE